MILTVSWPEINNSKKIYDLTKSKKFVFSEVNESLISRSVAEFDIPLNGIQKTFFDELIVIDSKIEFFYFNRIIWELNLDNMTNISIIIRQFQFCVGHPIFNQITPQTPLDITVGLTFNSHWRFDILEECTDCNELSCESEKDSDLIEGIGLDLRIFDFDDIRSIIQDYNFEEEIELPLEPENLFFKKSKIDRQEQELNANFKAIAKLKVFIDYAIEKFKQFENGPVVNDVNIFHAFSQPPIAITPASLRSHHGTTPRSGIVSFLFDNTSINTPKTPTKLIE